MKHKARWGAAAIVVLGVSAFAYYAMHRPPVPTDAIAEEASAPAGGKTRVELPPAKFDAAMLHTTSVSRRPLQNSRTVPGKISYRTTRRVDVKAPVDSMVQQVLVKPGDTVHPGTRLAVMESSEIGLVRAEVERNRADLAIAAKATSWAEDVSRNLQALLTELKKRPKPLDVETAFEEKMLGDYRQRIMSAYSKDTLAEGLWNDIQPLAAKGSVSLALVKNRETNREIAHNEYLAVCEQSRFDVVQNLEKMRSQSDYARRLLDVSRQKLRTLLGAFTEVSDVPETGSADGRELTRYYIIAPFDGTVEQRLVSDAQRVPLGTPLYVVADTAVLEVEADIREQDWQALTLRPGQSLSVKVPALGNREFIAVVDYVGGSVLPETQAVPLVALIQNKQRLLKPGMFVWVSIPLGGASDAVVVPPSALLTHEGKKFVFVEDGPRTFRRVDVTTGTETETGVAIVTGLRPDQRVVDRGAFILKSELLLESEDE